MLLVQTKSAFSSLRNKLALNLEYHRRPRTPGHKNANLPININKLNLVGILVDAQRIHLGERDKVVAWTALAPIIAVNGGGAPG